MKLDKYLYFDIETRLKPDAEERLLGIEAADLPQRNPAREKAQFTDWADQLVASWGVPDASAWLNEYPVDEESVLELITAESFTKKPRKGVLQSLNAELAKIRTGPLLSKDRSMIVDAMEIVAIGIKDGSGEAKSTLDAAEGLNWLTTERTRTFCGWNIASFDLPIVQLECIRYGIEPPFIVYDGYKQNFLDIYAKTRYWSGTRRLTDVAIAGGCVADDPLKGGFEVTDALSRGDKESVLRHVQCDIERLWHVACRYEKLIGDVYGNP